MMRWLKVVYVVTVICWAGSQVLFPSWQGRSYAPDFQKPMVFTESGSFGLQDDAYSGWQHPLWNPPRAYSDLMQATVRWPMQPVQQQNHIELDLSHMLEMISFGLIIAGVVLWLGHRIVSPHTPDLLVSIAWAMAIGLTLAWLFLLGFAVFTAGFGITGPVVITLLLGGLTFGIIYGLFAYQRQRMIMNEPVAKRSAVGVELFWFTLGAMFACAATWMAAWIASHLRGDIAGVTELGTTRFAQDQFTVNLITGCSIVAIGWLLALLMRRIKLSVALIAGWLIAITILGGVFAIWK